MARPRGNYRAPKTALGKKLHARRMFLNLTQAEAAALLNVSLRSYVAWESGSRKPLRAIKAMLETWAGQ